MNNQYVPNPDIKLVLNGGQEMLDSATVPIEWHFSKELIAKKPRYIVICDHERTLDGLQADINTHCGYRYNFAVKDLVGYIQIHKPGRHHFVAVVFYGDEEDEAKKAVRRFLKKSGSSMYEIPISYNEVKERTFWYNTTVTAVEFEVPAELFAKKPETAFGRFVWSWVNRWHDHSPVDECAYRKRKILAFTLQPILFVIGRSISGICLTLYVLFGAFILLLIGYRPVPLLKYIKGAWTDFEGCHPDLSRFSLKYRWRVWRDEAPVKKIPIWAVPMFVVLEVVMITLTIFLIVKFLTMAILLGVLIGTTCIAVIVAVVHKIRVRRRSEEWKQKQEEKKRRDEELARIWKQKQEEKKRRDEELARILKNLQEDRYLTYLKMNVMFDHVPGKVDVRRIMRKVDTVTRFRLSFWALKARVCRPYAK